MHAYTSHTLQASHKLLASNNSIKKMQSKTADFAPGASTRRTRRNVHIVFDSGPFAPLCENMTSSRQLEDTNILHCRQRRTEPRPQVTCIENLVKFGRVVYEIRKQSRHTNRQIYRHANSYTSHDNPVVISTTSRGS